MEKISKDDFRYGFVKIKNSIEFTIKILEDNSTYKGIIPKFLLIDVFDKIEFDKYFVRYIRQNDFLNIEFNEFDRFDKFNKSLNICIPHTDICDGIIKFKLKNVKTFNTNIKNSIEIIKSNVNYVRCLDNTTLY